MDLVDNAVLSANMAAKVGNVDALDVIPDQDNGLVGDPR